MVLERLAGFEVALSGPSDWFFFQQGIFTEPKEPAKVVISREGALTIFQEGRVCRITPVICECDVERFAI